MNSSIGPMTVGMLYSRWQQLRDQGQPVTPEDVCRDYPHFLEQLRELIRSGEVLFEIHGHSAAVESVATLPKDDPLDHSPATSSTLDASTSSISSSEMSEPGPTVSHHLPVQQRGETLVKPDIQGFEILSLLGMGGMGEVYKAKKIGFNITYALKIIRRDRVGLSAVERFRKEAEAMAKLEHPHIVRFFDVGVSETEDRPLYLTMRLLVGKTLAVRLGEWQNNLVKSVELMIKICSAVAYIHEQGMLHRDIKPGNVLFDEQDNPYVSDFGLVKETMLERPGQPRADESSLGPGIVAGQIREIPPTLPLTGIDTVLGTPPYMSPEQLAGNQSRLTPPSDVYALGVMLYELTVGHRPFRGSTVAEMRRLHATAEVALPSRHNVSFDSALEHILLKCLAWKPEDRYATAGELLRALEQWQRVQQDNRGPRIDRIPRKHRQGLSLALTVALLGIVSTAAFVLLSNNSTDVNQLLHQKRIDDAREEERLLEPNLWHSLLNREPTVLRGPKQVSLHYQRDRMELALASFRPAFVPLGQTEAPRYEIAVRVEQTPWVGNFGFFFGYGDNPKENEIAYQVVQLLSQRLGREEPQLKVIWTSTTAVRNHGSREEMTVTKHLSRPFPGLLGEHRLAVTVGPHGVETVFVDQLLVVTIPAAKSSPLPARTRRRFGIYIANGSVVFRDAQYRYFKEP